MPMYAKLKNILNHLMNLVTSKLFECSSEGQAGPVELRMLQESDGAWSLYEPSMGLLMVRCLMDRQRLLEDNPMLTEEILYQQAFDYVCNVYKGIVGDPGAGVDGDYCCNSIGDVVKIPDEVSASELYAKWYAVYMRAGAFAGAVALSDQAVIDVASVFAMAAAEAQGNLEMRNMIGEGVHAETV